MLEIYYDMSNFHPYPRLVKFVNKVSTIKRKQNIILDKSKNIKFTNKNRMFISVKWKKYLY